MRIGAVNYLNSKPLVYGLQELAPEARITYDLPSRLADSLSAGRLDVALVPSVEFFRTPGQNIVSDACVACRGPVLSVKLHFRVLPSEVRSVALDEGSRTSAALTQILLAELHGIRPELEPLPIGNGPESTTADAVLLIGDRAITEGRSSTQESAIRSRQSEIVEHWDLGQKWTQWTTLPFVFAMWVGRSGAELSGVTTVLETTRNRGVENIDAIAAREAPLLSISPKLAEDYFRHNLHFVLGSKEREGLRKFYRLCVKHGLAPGGLENMLNSTTNMPIHR